MALSYPLLLGLVLIHWSYALSICLLFLALKWNFIRKMIAELPFYLNFLICFTSRVQSLEILLFVYFIKKIICCICWDEHLSKIQNCGCDIFWPSHPCWIEITVVFFLSHNISKYKSSGGVWLKNLGNEEVLEFAFWLSLSLKSQQ